MSGKRLVGLAGSMMVGMALAGCQHRGGDRSCQTAPPYAQNTPPVTNSAAQNTNNWNTPGSGATGSMPGQTVAPGSANTGSSAWTSTPGMGTSGMNSMPAGRSMGMSTGSSLSGNSTPGSGLTGPATLDPTSASGSLIPPNPAPGGAGNVPVMNQNYDTLH